MVRLVSLYAKGVGAGRSSTAAGGSDNNNRYRTFRNESMSTIVEQQVTQPQPEPQRHPPSIGSVVAISRNTAADNSGDGFRRNNDDRCDDVAPQSTAGACWLRRICCWSSFTRHGASLNDERRRDQPLALRTHVVNGQPQWRPRRSLLFCCCCCCPTQKQQQRRAAPPVAVVSARYRPPQQNPLHRVATTVVVQTHSATNRTPRNGTVDKSDDAKANSAATKKPRHQKFWNWDDSFRSNADRFLQTLEEDSDDDESGGVRSVRRGYGKGAMKLTCLFGGRRGERERKSQTNVHASRFNVNV